jgi:hypothetical protein
VRSRHRASVKGGQGEAEGGQAGGREGERGWVEGMREGEREGWSIRVRTYVQIHVCLQIDDVGGVDTYAYVYVTYTQIHTYIYTHTYGCRR